MPEEFQQIIPTPTPSAETIATHQLAYEFRREVEYREDFNNYCEWYHLTAQQHQQELEDMRREINIFRWFLGGKTKSG